MRYTERGTGWMLLVIFLLLGCIPIVSHAKIVFTSKRDGATDYHIYMMEDNGSDVRRITSPDFYDIHPCWFPNGRRILFSRDLARGDGRVLNRKFYVVDVNGRSERNIMKNDPRDRDPALSPDGKQIAFESLRSGQWEIYTYHLENRELRQLTDDGWSGNADWSPDGRKLAYERDTAAEGENIWIMNADGSGKHRLSPPDKGVITLLKRGKPRWSPSGKYIMYVEREGIMNDGGIEKLAERLIIQAVNTGVREIHKFPVKYTMSTGCWLGDDHTVLLVINKDWADPTSNYEIYRYSLISRKLTNLTNHPRHDFHPDWISGSLAVSPGGKLSIQWAELKRVDEN